MIGMNVITVRNVGEAYAVALGHIHEYAVPEPSRNGAVLRLPYVLGTVFQRPRERVLYDATRNANPFFHLMESLWMLAGRQDVAWLAQFNGRMAQYSDDGAHFHGAYGYRWRRAYGRDQLRMIVTELAENPTSRRCVLQMWDTTRDLGRGGKDVPCNVTATVQLRPTGFDVTVPVADYYLDLTVFVRSHDLIWGAYGANAVHFSYVQEYLAAALGLAGRPCAVGRLVFVSVNPHVYQDVYQEMYPGPQLTQSYLEGPYEAGGVRPYPELMTSRATAEDWDWDAEAFLSDQWLQTVYAHPFWFDVAVPLRRAWDIRRADPAVALELVGKCQAPDWRLGCAEWLVRNYPSARLEVPAPWHTVPA